MVEFYDIPIILSDLDDSTRVVTLVINVTLDVGERKDVLVDGIKMRKGNYLVELGLKASKIRIA